MSKQFLAGKWYNELGSYMILDVDDDGGLAGIYYSAVGEAENEYILTGRYDADPPAGEGVSVGWVVTFRNSELNANSTTTWSGLYFNDAIGQGGRILTQWLLTSSTLPEDIWKSTNIGTDTFTRTKPSAADIAKARLLTFASPHTEDILAKK